MKYDPKAGTDKPGIAIMIGVKPSKKDDKKKYGTDLKKTDGDFRNVDGTPNKTGMSGRGRNPFRPGPHDISRPIATDWDWSERAAINAREKYNREKPLRQRESGGIWSSAPSNPTEAEKHGLTQEQYDDWQSRLNRANSAFQLRELQHAIPDMKLAMVKAWDSLTKSVSYREHPLHDAGTEGYGTRKRTFGDPTRPYGKPMQPGDPLIDSAGRDLEDDRKMYHPDDPFGDEEPDMGEFDADGSSLEGQSPVDMEYLRRIEPAMTEEASTMPDPSFTERRLPMARGHGSMTEDREPPMSFMDVLRRKKGREGNPADTRRR